MKLDSPRCCYLSLSDIKDLIFNHGVIRSMPCPYQVGEIKLFRCKPNQSIAHKQEDQHICFLEEVDCERTWGDSKKRQMAWGEKPPSAGTKRSRPYGLDLGTGAVAGEPRLVEQPTPPREPQVEPSRAQPRLLPFAAIADEDGESPITVVKVAKIDGGAVSHKTLIPVMVVWASNVVL
ncbi:hypothetical protein Pfo_008254 [Paulownia fortunei]|nr:hypothetical protein Pfo_008254 [Paulownia fortunei]